MYYIRFLKAPKLIQQSTGNCSVQFVLTIVTDLGEAPYPYDVVVLATIVHASKQKKLGAGDLQWKAGMRALPVDIPISSPFRRDPFYVKVESRQRSTAPSISSSGTIIMPEIVPVRSAPVEVNKGMLEADKLALRQIVLSNGQTISVWEDTGNSIAHHIWDAGMALVAFLDFKFASTLAEKQSEQIINVIELGTGCGLVGLSLAKLAPNSNVLLTDTEEVEEFITTHNIATDAKQVSYVNLNWESPIPNAVLNRHFDLIIVADCIYNPDSSPDLVKTIDALGTKSPGAQVLLAWKTRHSSEAVFFDLMDEAKFEVENECFVLAPNHPDDADEQSAEKIYIRTYSRTPP